MSRLLTIVLALAVVTNAVPLPASSKLQQPAGRNVRHTPVLQGELDNISAPAYIKDLFKNITNSNERHELNKLPSSDDLINAVRSFPNLVAGQCGRLGFNISIISSSELVVKAELRVRVNKADYSGRILAVLKHANRTQITSQEVTSDWIEFSMNNVVANWARQASHLQHNFTIELQNWDNKEPLRCTNTSRHPRIMTENTDRDQQPLLVVYSIEPNYEHIPIIKGIRRMMNQTQTETVTETRTRRSTLVKLDGPCQKHKVEEIGMDWLNKNKIVTDGTIIGPTSFQVGVCGGNCIRTAPVAPAHGIMFHLMATTQPGRTAHLTIPNQYMKCCVPLEYDDATFIMQQGTGKAAVISIFKLEKASVRKCGCVYYKDQTTSS